MYETLSGSNSDRYQYVLPSYNFSKNFNLENIDGSFNFNSSGNNTLRDTNITTSSISNDLDYSSVNAFFDNGNSDYNLDEITEQMSKDLEISNMFCLRGVWSLDKSKCDKLEVVDFEKVRYRLDDELIAVSNNWSDLRDNTIKLIEPFDSGKRDAREFYLIYQEKSKQSVEGRIVNDSSYPQPPYSGGLTSILTDVKINKYQLSEITSGFSTGTIINLNNGIPTDDKEKRAIEKERTGLSPSGYDESLTKTSGKRPPARDGHTGIIIEHSFFVFGGDRH
jgi:hypothetical protein